MPADIPLGRTFHPIKLIDNELIELNVIDDWLQHLVMSCNLLSNS